MRDILRFASPRGSHETVQEKPMISQGVEAHSKKPVLVGTGLRRKAVCSYLIRLTTHQCQGSEKCANTRLQALIQPALAV